MAQAAKQLASKATEKQFVLARVGRQLLGVNVMMVRDALGACPITPLPLAPPAIAGSLNLRGHIVTAFDLHYALGIETSRSHSQRPGLVIQWKDDRLYDLLVDETTEVLTMPQDDFEPNPPHLGENWQKYSLGIYRLEKELMVVLDVDALLDI